jgi:hypothetical protein
MTEHRREGGAQRRPPQLEPAGPPGRDFAIARAPK